MNPAVVLLARAPSAKGKTRLTAAVAEARAHELRVALLLDTADVVRTARLPLIVAFTPESAREELAHLLPDARLVAQEGSDLGDRMRHGLAAGLATGADAVALIGSDLPALPPERLTDACEMLGSGADVVLGPSEDGGFYLVAATAPLPEIFGGVTWSGSDVFERVVKNAHARALTIGVLPPWWDLDAPADLRRVLADPRPRAARRVRAWVRGG